MLRTRLYLGLLPLLLLLIGTGAYAIYMTRQLTGSLQRDLVGNYRDILACEQMRSTISLMNVDLADRIRGDPLEVKKRFDETRAAFTRELMAQSASSAGTSRAPLIEALDEAFQESVAGNRRLLDGDNSLGAVRESEAALFRVRKAIDTLTEHDFAAAQETAQRAARLEATTERVLFMVIAGAVVLSLLLAWQLAASLLTPIKALTATAVAVGDGDLDRVVPVVSRDELGQLARVFNQMAAKLRGYREATMAKVLRTQRTMEATLTSAPDPVFVVARDGTHEVRNPAAEQLASSPDFQHGFPPPLAEPLAKVFATGEHYLPTDYGRVVTLRVGREDRHYLPRILAIGDALTDFSGAAVVLQDVTKFRLLDDAKTNLVGTVSHELKTPLTGLRMAVYLLLEQNVGALTPQQRELLEGARDDSDRLLRILDNLLDLARLEAGAAGLERREVRVGALVEDIASEAESFVAAAGQKLEVSIDAETKASRVKVDVGRLRHVFINLLTNASKYSSAETVIMLKAEIAPLNLVRFAVRDQGVGIPPEAVSHVFDRFYRVPGQTQLGVGLGLAIAREIVIAHGGTIACTSDVGRGTEFSFMLPVVRDLPVQDAS
jgi:signal transduction histidine kinase